MKFISKCEIAGNRAAVLLGISLTVFVAAALSGDTEFSGSLRTDEKVTNESEELVTMQISITVNGDTTVYELNNCRAAKDLYAQLPLEVDVQDYGGKEKIFYPPQKLNTAATPMADAHSGTLAYYAPWGNVVMFYENFGKASGLYELGYAVAGAEHIHSMSGKIEVLPMNSQSGETEE